MLKFLLATALFFTTRAFAANPPPASPAQKPDIVFILIDDMGWKDIGCMGSAYYETPNIDKLAAQGMLFTAAYSAAPNCAPSRASLMTGMYTPRHHIYTVGDSNRGPIASQKLIPVPNTEVLDPKWKTIANVLDDAGYMTASIGKWHIGKDPAAGPLAHGFHVNVGGNNQGSASSFFPPYRNPNLPDGPAGEYLTDRLTDEALKFIDANKSRPFFLYLAHNAVHKPLMGKPELVAKYKAKARSGGQNNAVYAAMIESVDQSVGRIMARLEELHLSDHTLVIFSSDNGGVGDVTSMQPLRGEKGMLYEGGVRVPFIARWPGRIAPGSRSDVPITGVDIMPTFAAVAGGKLPATQPQDGLSILPLLDGSGKTLAREAIYWHFPCYLPGSNMGRGLRMVPATSLLAGTMKYQEFYEDSHAELYNLHDDISEQHDLLGSNARQTEKLRNLMDQWRKAVNAPIPTQPNPQYNPSATGKNKNAKGKGGGGGD